MAKRIVNALSVLSGKKTQMELDMTIDQWDRYLEGKEHIQTIFPEYTPEQREFLKTGMTPEEQKQIFG